VQNRIDIEHPKPGTKFKRENFRTIKRKKELQNWKLKEREPDRQGKVKENEKLF
jgi:hypothetical protein